MQVVELSNNLLQDMPRKLRDVFEDMTHENTPPVVFDFIIFCRMMIKELKVELELLKNARADNID